MPAIGKIPSSSFPDPSPFSLQVPKFVTGKTGALAGSQRSPADPGVALLSGNNAAATTIPITDLLMFYLVKQSKG